MHIIFHFLYVATQLTKKKGIKGLELYNKQLMCFCRSRKEICIFNSLNFEDLQKKASGCYFYLHSH